MDLDQRIIKATELLEGVDSCVIVGSSFGGLLASLMHQRYPDKIKGLILCAPAFHRAEADAVESLPPTTVIHGYQDEVVPWSAVDAKARQLGVYFISVEDNHRLSQHHKLMGDELSRLLRFIEA
jgi:pimeloyl-ACP methyl ester carboxylesterase